MGNKSEAKSVLIKRGKYTLEFKLEAFRLVKGGQDIATTSKVLGMPDQTLWSWPASRWSATSKKATAYVARESL